MCATKRGFVCQPQIFCSEVSELSGLEISVGSGDVLVSVKLNTLLIKLFSFLNEARFGFHVTYGRF